jgi:hypothetical protein
MASHMTTPEPNEVQADEAEVLTPPATPGAEALPTDTEHDSD